MNIFDLQAKLSLDKSDFDKGINDAKGSASTFGSVLKANLASDVIRKGFSVLIDGCKKTAQGLIAMGKAALESYANYEQLAGGVETLFKDSADEIKQYAQNAWQTAQMSANEYMETATSFSASLIQSLGGDTKKAAEVADRAIRDMSDNANKMGTSMESIQNAYQGFAKQNYTMLDNLKLGYGGTQQEMKRLIEDASKMTDVQAELGVTVDSGSMSFANIANAIHVVQAEMGIYGTTAEEALHTIEGSLNATKAAWQNVLSAIAGGGDIKQAFEGLTTSIFGDGSEGSGLMANIIPRVQQIMEGIADFMTRAAPILADKIPQIVEQLKPAFSAMVDAIGKVFTEIAPVVLPIIGDLIEAILGAFADALGESGGLLGLIGDVINFVIDNKELVIAAILEIITTVNILNAVMMANPIGLIIELVAAVIAALYLLYDNWDTIWGGICTVFETIWNTIKGIFTDIWDTIVDIFTDAWEGIKETFSAAVDFFGGVFSAAFDAICNAFSAIGDFFAGIWDGIVDTFSYVGTAVADAIGGAFKSAINAVITVVEGAINLIPNAINGAIGLINLLPGVEIPKIPKVRLPRLARGGIVDRETAFVAGEAGKEAIIPLERNTEWIDRVAERLDRGATTIGDTVINVYATENQNPRDIADAVADIMQERFERKKAVYGTVAI